MQCRRPLPSVRSYSNGTIDITNTTKPKVIASFDMKTLGLTTHGLSVSNDGNRMYGVMPARPATAAAVADPNVPSNNGFVVLDTSEAQPRLPNAKIKHISTVMYKDGSTAGGSSADPGAVSPGPS